MKISQLCFLATHLALLGNPVAITPRCENRNKAQAHLSSLEVEDDGGPWKGLGCLGGVSAANHL